MCQTIPDYALNPRSIEGELVVYLKAAKSDTLCISPYEITDLIHEKFQLLTNVTGG